MTTLLLRWAMCTMDLLVVLSHQLQIAFCGVCSLELTDGFLMSFSGFSRTYSSNFGSLSLWTSKGIGRLAARRLEVEMRISRFDKHRDWTLYSYLDIYVFNLIFDNCKFGEFKSSEKNIDRRFKREAFASLPPLHYGRVILYLLRNSYSKPSEWQRSRRTEGKRWFKKKRIYKPKRHLLLKVCKKFISICNIS